MSSGPASGSEPERRPVCARCEYFNPAPQDIEKQLPGLRALGSAYAAVRSDDGLCDHHARYVAASSGCDAFRRRLRTAPQPA